MPKEIVYDAAYRDNADPQAGIEHVAVGWAKDRTVQLGFTRGPIASMAVYTPGLTSTPDVSAAGGDPVSLGEPEPVDSLWMDLDRAGINHLIRSLRRARDAAYGADA